VQIIIETETCTYHEGPAENPSLTITTPDHIWRDISLGKLDGTKPSSWRLLDIRR